MFDSAAPIRDLDDDEYDVAPFVERLLKPLLQAPTSGSLVVGLYAPWGHGKTSALNLLEAALKRTAQQQQLPSGPVLLPQAVVIRFNPWLYGSVEALLTSF